MKGEYRVVKGSQTEIRGFGATPFSCRELHAPAQESRTLEIQTTAVGSRGKE